MGFLQHFRQRNQNKNKKLTFDRNSWIFVLINKKSHTLYSLIQVLSWFSAAEGVNSSSRKDFLQGGREDVRPFSKLLSTKALNNSATTDLVAGMGLSYGKHVASMCRASTEHFKSISSFRQRGLKSCWFDTLKWVWCYQTFLKIVQTY